MNSDVDEDVGAYRGTSDAANVVHVQSISRINVEVQRGAVTGARARGQSATHRLILRNINQLNKGLRSGADGHSSRRNGYGVLDHHAQPIAVGLGSCHEG